MFPYALVNMHTLTQGKMELVQTTSFVIKIANEKNEHIQSISKAS